MAFTMAPTRPQFRRRLLGYARGQVDAFLDEAVHAHQAAQAEIERAREATEPLARIGSEVAAILRTLADSVAAAQDRAEEEAARHLAEAEARASELREAAERDREAAREALDEAQAEARRVVADAEARMQAVLDERLAAEREHEALVAERRGSTEDALERAARNLQAALDAVRGVEAAPRAAGIVPPATQLRSSEPGRPATGEDGDGHVAVVIGTGDGPSNGTAASNGDGASRSDAGERAEPPTPGTWERIQL